MNIQLVLLCQEGESRQAYLKEARLSGAEVDVVATYKELFNVMSTRAYNGILIDLATNLRITSEERQIIQDALNSFPAIQLQWKRESDSVYAMMIKKTLRLGTLGELIETECRHFPARPIRLYERKELHFNVRVAQSETKAAKGEFIENTTTFNVSLGGCFLISAQDWSNFSHVWFIFNELKDGTPILGKICWSIPWGKTMKIPGLGICFEHITKAQVQELTELLHPLS